MTDTNPDYGDPTTAPFWEAAARHELMVQRCDSCGHHQFYPRPFCLACGGDDLDWAEVSGKGAVYSLTVPRIPVGPGFEPPYPVALVELDEGPRMLTNIVNGEAAIGDRVRLAWKDRKGAPPLPVFEPDAG